MKNIKDFDLDDLKKELIEIGEKPFRAEQIFKWLYQEKVKEFDEMTNLSLALREKLKENYDALLETIIKAKPAAAKGTYLRSIAISTTMGAGIKINPRQ